MLQLIQCYYWYCAATDEVLLQRYGYRWWSWCSWCSNTTATVLLLMQCYHGLILLQCSYYCRTATDDVLLLMQCWYLCSAATDKVLLLMQSYYWCTAATDKVILLMQCYYWDRSTTDAVLLQRQCYFWCSAATYAALLVWRTLPPATSEIHPTEIHGSAAESLNILLNSWQHWINYWNCWHQWWLDLSGDLSSKIKVNTSSESEVLKRGFNLFGQFIGF